MLGIIKKLAIKSNDIDKYISLTLEIEQGVDTNNLVNMMLKSVNIEITPNEV